MKKEIQFMNQIDINYNEITDSLSIYEIKIKSPFVSKVLAGLGYTKHILNFLNTPNNEILEKIPKEGNWLLIKEDALKDLQKEAELKKYIDIKSENYPGKVPQFQYSYKIIDKESIKEINEENINKINEGFVLINFDLEDKIIKNINDQVIYFEQLYYLPINEIIDVGAEGITHYNYSSAPRISLDNMIKKGLKNSNTYTTEQDFLNSFRKLLRKRENLQYVSDGNEVSRLINVKQSSYQKAWDLFQAFKENWEETNESIMLTLLLFKIEGIDQKLGFNTSIFYENNIRNKTEKLITYQSIVSSISLEYDLTQKKRNTQKTKI